MVLLQSSAGTDSRQGYIVRREKIGYEGLWVEEEEGFDGRGLKSRKASMEEG